MKKLLLFSCLFLLAQVSCYAQVGDTAGIKITPVIKTPALRKPLGGVGDYEKLYTPVQVKQLDTIIAQFKRKTPIEVVLITVNPSSTTEDGFGDYALDLANKWFIGKKYKGTAVLVAISKKYHKMRICTNPNAEKFLSEADAQQLMNNYYIPEFKGGNYFEGTRVGLLNTMKILRDRYK